MFWYYTFLVACIPLALVPPIFIYHKIYKDGIIGRLALAGMSAMAWITWIFHFYADESDSVPLGLIALLVIFMATFMIWHLFRFHFRVVKEQTANGAKVCAEVFK